MAVSTVRLQAVNWVTGFNPVWLMIIPMIMIITSILLTVLWLSFVEGLPGTPEAHYTWSNFTRLYTDSFVFTALSNTIGFAVVTILVSLFFGISIAWLAERTDFPGKTFVYTLMSLSLLLPGFFTAMGWLFLLHPRIGMLNRWLMEWAGLQVAPLNITTVTGMGWVQGLNLSSLAFIMAAASFRSMDPALEEAATVHGASFGQMLQRIFLPLMIPGILASGLYIFTIAIASFDVPAIIGLSNRIYTFSTFVYAQSVAANNFPEYGSTAAMSIMMVAVALVLAYWYSGVIKKAHQYQVVTGKAYRPQLYPLGKWVVAAWLYVGAYVVLTKVLPLLLIAWAAGLPYFQPPSVEAIASLSFKNFQAIPFDLLLRGVRNTGILMLVVPTFAVVASFCFSWMVIRSRSRYRALLDFFAFLPHAVPGIIFAVGALFIALFVLKGLPLYGSLTLLAIVYVVDRLSFCTRILNSALIQIHQELEEAAMTCGAGGLQAARSVLAPLVWPAILHGWLWMALITYRELTVATILFTPDNMTLPVVVWNMWAGGNLGMASATTLIMLSVLAPLILLYYYFGTRLIPGFRSTAN